MDNLKFKHLKMRAFGTPLLLRPEKAAVIFDILAEKFDGEKFAAVGFEAEDRAEYQVINESAMIELKGTLVKESSFMCSLSGLTSYDAIRNEINMALEDPAVNNITLLVDSPGGEASGCADLADFISTANEQKPVTAFVNGNCCSAAYWIASSCERIVATQDSEIGSIGAVMGLKDFTERNKKEGIKMHFFYEGAAKLDGNPNKPFSDDEKARLQEGVSDLYELFTSAVAKNRNMAVEAVKNTEARVFMGAKAIEQGLIDEIGTIETVIESMKPRPQGGFMADKTETNVNAETVDTTAKAETESAPVKAETPSIDVEAIKAEAKKAAITEERERMATIDKLAVKGYSKLAAQAKSEGWDKLRFLEAQTEAIQAMHEKGKSAITETEDDPVVAEPRTEAKTEKAPEKLTRNATDDEIKAVWEKTDTVKAEFATFDHFAAYTRRNGYKVEEGK